MSPALTTATLILDVVLGLVLLAYTVEGWAFGFVRIVGRAVGITVGGLLGLRFGPEVVARVDGADGAGRFALLAGVVILAALVGTVVVTASVRRLVPTARGPRRVLDQIAGAVTALVIAAGVAWLGAGVVRLAFPGDIARSVADSRVLAVIDDISPVTRAQVLDRAAEAFAAGGFPRVFADAEDEPVTTVPAGDPAVVRDPDVARAARSVVQIVSSAPRCGGPGQLQVGSGFVVSGGLVVTNAHVVTGGDRVQVVKGRLRSTARVVAFDPERDLAVLAADVSGVPALHLTSEARRGDAVAIAGYPEGGPLTVQPGRMDDALTARGHDIYGEGEVLRRVRTVRADIHPGNSGGPVIDDRGEVAGIVFARSAQGRPTAFALDTRELTPVLDAAAPRRTVGVGPCIAE